MTPLAGQLLRFTGLGALNTMVTGVLLAVLARLMDPLLAFTLAFTLGLAFVTMTTGRFVFSNRATPRQRVLFAAWYLLVYMVGLSVVGLMDERSSSPLLLAATTVLVTAPLGFLGGRLIFTNATPDPARTGGDR